MSAKTILLGAFPVLLLAAAAAVYCRSSFARKNSPKVVAVDRVIYNPPSPYDAPATIKSAVTLGYNILNNPQKYVSEYVGDSLTCSNCHFNGGISPGGRNGGLSLVGVAAKYPAYRSRSGRVDDMISRTNACFQRSMNGRPLPPDSKEMVAIVTYFHWISKGIQIYQRVPWLGIKHIKSGHRPDAVAGKKIFEQSCIACHGNDGQGTKVAPPLWGKHSFNDGAGMARLQNFAAFVHDNMPYRVSNLTPSQALDVAAFVTGQPRPHFGKKRIIIGRHNTTK